VRKHLSNPCATVTSDHSSNTSLRFGVIARHDSDEDEDSRDIGGADQQGPGGIDGVEIVPVQWTSNCHHHVANRTSKIPPTHIFQTRTQKEDWSWKRGLHRGQATLVSENAGAVGQEIEAKTG
jgi:hypothetical protein